MIKFIKSLFAPAVKIETPTVSVTEVAAAAEVVPFPVEKKKPAVKKATTRKPKADAKPAKATTRKPKAK